MLLRLAQRAWLTREQYRLEFLTVELSSLGELSNKGVEFDISFVRRHKNHTATLAAVKQGNEPSWTMQRSLCFDSTLFREGSTGAIQQKCYSVEIRHRQELMCRFEVDVGLFAPAGDKTITLHSTMQGRRGQIKIRATCNKVVPNPKNSNEGRVEGEVPTASEPPLVETVSAGCLSPTPAVSVQQTPINRVQVGVQTSIEVQAEEDEESAAALYLAAAERVADLEEELTDLQAQLEDKKRECEDQRKQIMNLTVTYQSSLFQEQEEQDASFSSSIGCSPSAAPDTPVAARLAAVAAKLRAVAASVNEQSTVVDGDDEDDSDSSDDDTPTNTTNTTNTRRVAKVMPVDEDGNHLDTRVDGDDEDDSDSSDDDTPTNTTTTTCRVAKVMPVDEDGNHLDTRADIKPWKRILIQKRASEAENRTKEKSPGSSTPTSTPATVAVTFPEVEHSWQVMQAEMRAGLAAVVGHTVQKSVESRDMSDAQRGEQVQACVEQQMEEEQLQADRYPLDRYQRSYNTEQKCTSIAFEPQDCGKQVEQPVQEQVGQPVSKYASQALLYHAMGSALKAYYDSGSAGSDSGGSVDFGPTFSLNDGEMLRSKPARLDLNEKGGCIKRKGGVGGDVNRDDVPMPTLQELALHLTTNAP